MCHWKVGLVTLALLGLRPPTARAAFITVYNTGVNNSGTPLSGGSIDSHFTWTGPGGSGHAVVLSNLWSQWVPNNSTSAWIGFEDDPGGNSMPYGTYTFEQTFDLTGYDPTTAVLSGRWAADQDGSIQLNGVTKATVADGNWNSANAPNLTAFTINSGFVAGINHLTFVVREPDGFDGLRVDGLTLQATPLAAVHVPASLALAGIGALTLGGYHRLRRRLGLRNCSTAISLR